MIVCLNIIVKTGKGEKMKRIGRIFLLFVAMALFFACTHTTGTSVNMPVAPVLDSISKKGELVVGTAGSMPPLNMTTKEGNIIGFDADLAALIASAMGVNLRLEAMPFADLLPALEAGKIDMVLSGMTMTPRRNLRVAFVGPYLVSGKAFLTKIERIASATDTSDLNSSDTSLVALKGSTSQDFVEEFIPKARLMTAKDYDEAVDMVLQDKVDALVADYPICVVSVLRYPDQGLLSIVAPLTYEPLGIAMPANDALLVNWVNNFINTLKVSGGLMMLNDRWFSEGSWMKNLK